MAQTNSISRASRENSSKNWALLRLILGFVQMFGAVFSLALVIYLGMVPRSLGALIATGLVTTLSIVLFGKKPFGILRERFEKER